MDKRFKRLAASAGLVGALAIGAITMIPSEASAAVPCGATVSREDVPFTRGAFKITYWTIRNCHSYSVRRKFNVTGGSDKLIKCQTIPARSTKSGMTVPHGFFEVVTEVLLPC